VYNKFIKTIRIISSNENILTLLCPARGLDNWHRFRVMVSDTFNSPFKVLFIFPSQYLFAIDLDVILYIQKKDISCIRTSIPRSTTRNTTITGFFKLIADRYYSDKFHYLDLKTQTRNNKCWSHNSLRIQDDNSLRSLADTKSIQFCFFYHRLLICLNSAGRFPLTRRNKFKKINLNRINEQRALRQLYSKWIGIE